MRARSWLHTVAMAGVAVGAFVMLAGSVVGGAVGAAAAAYGVLVVLSALLIFAGIAIRARAGRVLQARGPRLQHPRSVQGRRVF